MFSRNQSDEDFLHSVNLAQQNTLNDTEILLAMTEFGYDAAKINEGVIIYQGVYGLFQQQKTEYTEQYAASEDLKIRWAESNRVTMSYVKVARVALKSDYGAYIKLGLDKARNRSLSGWISQARQFYANALSATDILTKLAGFGITDTKLNAGKQLVDETETLNITHKKEMGEAQQATLDRDNAIDNLEDWISDFIAIARIALADRPQLLEKLGIVQPS